MERIAILHYASPPVIGGVESTIAYHARTLMGLGYPVRVISGSGDQFLPDVEFYLSPLFGSSAPELLRVKKELDAGQVTPNFEALKTVIAAELRSALADCSHCIVHNILTLHKNLPLTAAMATLTDQVQIIAWCHDFAWKNTQYLPELHDGYPWNLLREVWPRTRYVTVSEPARTELADLLDFATEKIMVVTPGIDPARFFHWTTTTQMLVEKLGLLDAAGLLLLPARLTRRKNIGLALHVLSEIRAQSQLDFRLIVTGPPGPHNPTNTSYLDELLTLRHDLRLADYAHFLYTAVIDTPLLLDDDTIANFYQLSDALFFPSTQEGFGIPILEAGLAGLPIFCADILALHHTAGPYATYFDPLTASPSQLAEYILSTLAATPTYQLRRRVRNTYRWETIIREQLVPLLEG